MYTVCGAQDKCIIELKRIMTVFLNNKRHGYTKVFPLSIPTGWGKTRIAIQSILKSVSRKSVNVILWPQNKNHVKRIWQRTDDWKGDSSKKYFFIPCWNPLHKKICTKDFRYYFYHKNGKELEPNVYNEKSFNNYRDVKFYWRTNRNHEFKGDVKNLRFNLGSDSIFYIIDEWHSFDLINEFREKYPNIKNAKPSEANALAEKFWRERLLFGNCKKNNLFVLLLSATPIASADSMDKIFDKADSSNINKNYDEEDVKAKEAVQSDLDLFDIMTRVKFNNMTHKAHEIFPKVFKNRSRDLVKIKASEEKKFKKLKKEFPLESFANYYISVANKIAKTKIKFPYQREQSVFAESDSLKVFFLKEFLKRCPSNQRILIFCHYRSTVAKKLSKSLEEFGDKLVYLNEKLSDTYINKCIDDFNDKDKGKIRYLIVTDMYSQGVDLHKADAWILHYELAWNPIRIIQRFGRVWRMNRPGAKMDELSHPVAFYMPLTYSSEEEQRNRLKRRWNTLKEIFTKNAKMIAPIDFEIALGIRLTPKPEIIQKK